MWESGGTGFHYQKAVFRAPARFQGCHIDFFNAKFLKTFFLKTIWLEKVVWIFGVFLVFFSSAENMSNHVYTKNFGKFWLKLLPANKMVFFFFFCSAHLIVGGKLGI